MYNLLIVEDNSDYLRNFINIISDEIPNIKIDHVTCNEKETFKVLDKQSIDIILLDSTSPNYSGVDILAYIDKHGLYKYRNSVIAISSKLNTLNVLTYHSYLFSYHFKDVDYDSIIESLKLCVDEKNNALILEDVRKKIHDELEYLNYNYSYKGTTYLEETILELYKVKYDFDSNLSQSIYPILAHRHKKSISTIYGNIKQSTRSMIADCETSKIMDYFHYNKFTKPRIKEIIFTVLNKL